jgi:pimeloyl-ACP methyl ester carboxylesterase
VNAKSSGHLGLEPDPIKVPFLTHRQLFPFRTETELITLSSFPGPAPFRVEPNDSFRVVAPFLPGYTFSFAPRQKRFGIEEIAEVFAALMSDVLGYSCFGAQGGDWGGFEASRLGYAYPEWVIGIHLNLLAVRRDAKMLEKPTEDEHRFIEELNHWLKEEIGYQCIQGTKPQTLAFDLADSPAGLAAWIVEKFRSWTDCGVDPENALRKDEMLTNIMLYWVTGAIGVSF